MSRLIPVVFVLLFSASAVRADDWPGWRGPAGTGITNETDLPVSWSATDNVRWKISLEGAGVSSPVVVGERVFLTASDGRFNDQLHVTCYDRSKGELLWHVKLFGSAVSEGQYAPGGMAVPTPAADAKRLYALFGTGDLVCLDHDGKPVWMRSLAQEYGPFRNRWGMAASPMLVGELLVVQVDHWGESYLLGIDAATGANRWRTVREASVNWTSPLAVTVKGRTQIVAAGTYKVKGYDAKDGSELWSVRGLEMQCIPSPVTEKDMVYAVSGRQNFTLAIKLDGRRGDLPDFLPRHPRHVHRIRLSSVSLCGDRRVEHQCISRRIQATYSPGGRPRHASVPGEALSVEVHDIRVGSARSRAPGQWSPTRQALSD